ncbi:MAG TPA: ABC transporter substrate-binding protein, partial [Paracoccaceae bacterium]|nr:ABC transporter substrate-binding protein [Paracoccaceae bacterium]
MTITRRTALTGLAAGAAAATGWAPYVQAQSSKPIRIGFQVHRTGIGAVYGRWYDRVTEAAVARINAAGGINGRPVEIIAEDDGTDPKRGAEVVEKFATLHDCDVGYGTLFSHVVIASAPRAGELKLPYFVVSEGTHVPSGMLNRWTIQPGITDVKAQVVSMAPYIAGNLGKKVTMIFPDYAFGYSHRDNLPAAMQAQGGEVVAQIAIPPTETSFFKYFPQIPPETEVIYHVMVGPAVLTFVKEMGDFYGGGPRPEIFGFVDSIEAVPVTAPGLEFLEGTHFWEAMPRYAQADQPEEAAFYRQAVGVDDTGASTGDAKDVSTYSHMFGCWETLYVIKAAMEAAGYQGPADRQKLIEAVEAMGEMPLS